MENFPSPHSFAEDNFIHEELMESIVLGSPVRMYDVTKPENL